MDQTKKTPYEGLVAGVYSGSVSDWGIREATIGTSKQLLAFIAFDFESNGKVHRMNWEGFFFKKDGDINSKTMDTLTACGFRSTDISTLMSETALNMQKKVNLTIELVNGYWKVEWVNDPDQSPRGRADEVKSLAGYDLSRINAALAKKNMGATSVKNHAPGADGKTANERGLGF